MKNEGNRFLEVNMRYGKMRSRRAGNVQGGSNAPVLTEEQHLGAIKHINKAQISTRKYAGVITKTRR